MKKYISVLLIIMLLTGMAWAMPPKPGSGIPHPIFPKGMEEPNKLKVKPGELKDVWNCLVILIDFSDTSPSHSVASFDDMMFGSWTPGSVSDYYYEVSYGQFSITGIVVGWYEAANSHNYYGGGGYGIYGSYPNNAPRLVEEAVDAAQAGGVNFSLYDNDGDGEVESMFIVHQGPGAEETGNTNDIWSHKWAISYGGGTARYYDGVWINSYTIQPEAHSDNSHIDIGVFCHEYAHALGLPDLYDYNSGSWTTIDDANDNPICDWCLMASGSWGNGDGSIPSHICGWGKWQLGWITPIQGTINASATATIYDIEEYENDNPYPSFVVVYPGNNPSSSQYFLLEYRRTETRTTNDLFDHYDSDYWSGPALQLDQGLIIMHVDDNQPDGGGRWNDGSPSNSNYGIWVEAPGYNPAHAGDGFPEWTVNSSDVRYEIKTGAAFGDVVDQLDFGYNDPISTGGWWWANSRRYSGSNTGIELSNIGAADPPGGPTMSLQGIQLPAVSIELISFTGMTTIDGVLLNWRTALEYNTLEWVIERAPENGTEYTNIAIVESKGNSPQGESYGFLDKNIESGKAYRYRLIRIDSNGNKTTYGPVSVLVLPREEKITAIYPSPFRTNISIEYHLPGKTRITAEIYGVDGRFFKTVESGTKDAGSHSILWDGNEIPQGIYLFRLTTENAVFTEKIVKLK